MILKNKYICIIGGAGFVGLHLTEMLIKYNKVKVIDIGNYNDKLYLKNILPKNCYIDKYKENYNCIINENFDYIFYLAGNTSIIKSVEMPVYDLKTNLLPLLELLELLKGKKTKLIFASSAACYGEMQNKKNNYPISPYGITKLAAENYLRYYHENYRISIIICRFFSLFGEYNKKQVIYDTIKKLINNPECINIINPDSKRDFIYIKDALNIVLSLCVKGNFDSEIYDIGSGKATSIFEISHLIIKYLKIKPNILLKYEYKKYEPKIQVANVKPLIKMGIDINFSLENRLQKTIKWVKNNL